MKVTQLISFDLQGTLSDSAFSDEFWLELLPALYAKKHQITSDQAKNLIESEFKSIGKYHALFYDYRLRLNELLPKWEFQNLVGRLKNKPKLDHDVLTIIKNIPQEIPKIILSATTRDFIDLELGEAKQYFHNTFSTIDDFNTPGKPPVLFQKIASLMKVRPEDCLHIGDCHEMDYENAKKASWSSFHLNLERPRKESLFELENAVHGFLKNY